MYYCYGAELNHVDLSAYVRYDRQGPPIVGTHSIRAYKERHPLPFYVFPGYSDILLPALVKRASGCITGTVCLSVDG